MTITMHTVVEGTNARVKKVIPVAGTLASGKLLPVMAERPELPNPSYFPRSFFNCDVSHGAVTLRPNDDAVTVSLGNVTTMTSAISGDVDFGTFPPPVGSGSVRVFLVLAVTRVGD